MKTTEMGFLKKNFKGSSPGQLLWVSSNEVVFSVDERGSKRYIAQMLIINL
ncbi:MAG: hypothetical protein CM15mP22_7380 [Gammaproteobacteria bacterium]|nr:MAG: hypothetical protein CM15mP22_7380 [Gammaproteobacteria bacterium]